MFVHRSFPLQSRDSNSSSIASSWYIILGVVLGLALLVGVIIGVSYFLREKCCGKRYRSKLRDHIGIDGNNVNNSYEQMARHSETSTEKNLKIDPMKQHRRLRSTSTDGNDGDQQTQTNFPPLRSKPPTGRPLSTHGSHSKENMKNPSRERKFSLPASNDAATNTINIVKGIPIGLAPPKAAVRIPSNETEKVSVTSVSDNSAATVPLTAAKRAKILPPLKNGIYDDSTNDHLLNTSAGALVTSQRQRRRSALWFRKQNPNMISPLPPRPQSDVTQKTNFDYDGSFDDDRPPIPTIESLTKKTLKPLRTVPLLNISVVPAWADDSTEQL